MAKEMICTQCGTVGNGKKSAKGSFLIEVILWLCFLIPGLIYSIWRVSGNKPACRSCGSASLVPLDSPVGQKLKREHGQ